MVNKRTICKWLGIASFIPMYWIASIIEPGVHWSGGWFLASFLTLVHITHYFVLKAKMGAMGKYVNVEMAETVIVLILGWLLGLLFLNIYLASLITLGAIGFMGVAWLAQRCFHFYFDFNDKGHYAHEDND